MHSTLTVTSARAAFRDRHWKFQNRVTAVPLLFPPCPCEQKILIRFFGLPSSGTADGDIGSIRYLITLVFCIDPAYESKIDTIAFVGTEKRMSIQLRHQGGQLVVNLKSFSVLSDHQPGAFSFCRLTSRRRSSRSFCRTGFSRYFSTES